MQLECTSAYDSLLYIWVIKPTGKINFEQVNLNKSLQELVTSGRKSLGVFDRAVVRPREGVPTTQSLQQLHEILIKPIAQYLPTDPNERVIFLPQGELFLVPFPALQDEQEKYLIEKHTILTAPAIQVLQLTRELGSRESGVGKL
ncbi:MAG: CHAT domain-containing protein [Coleofasciculaceae cyanobacterium]